MTSRGFLSYSWGFLLHLVEQRRVYQRRERSSYIHRGRGACSCVTNHSRRTAQTLVPLSPSSGSMIQYRSVGYEREGNRRHDIAVTDGHALQTSVHGLYWLKAAAQDL